MDKGDGDGDLVIYKDWMKNDELICYEYDIWFEYWIFFCLVFVVEIIGFGKKKNKCFFCCFFVVDYV